MTSMRLSSAAFACFASVGFHAKAADVISVFQAQGSFQGGQALGGTVTIDVTQGYVTAANLTVTGLPVFDYVSNGYYICNSTLYLEFTSPANENPPGIGYPNLSLLLPSLVNYHGGNILPSATGGTPGNCGFPETFYSGVYTGNSVNVGDLISGTLTSLGSQTASIRGPKELWWFNGEQPPTYATSGTLTAQPSGGTSYTWNITSGSSEVSFSNGSSSMVTDSNTVSIMTIGASPVGVTNDVSATVTVNGLTSRPFKLTALTPYSLEPQPAESSCGSYSNPDHPKAVGFLCHICYSILDQEQNVLPSAVPVSEEFTTRFFPDYDGETWNHLLAPCGQEKGPSLCGSPLPQQVCDQMDVAEGPAGDLVPVPLTPRNGNTKVVHYSGYFSAGSPLPARGEEVQIQTWQMYQDHGFHTGIIAPPYPQPQ